MNARNQAADTVLTLRNVDKRYGNRLVLKGLNLSLAAGEILALVGHNGAGKTTLMKLVLGLTRPAAGSIATAAGSSHLVGYLPEVAAFPATISARDMLRFYARLKRRPEREVDELLSQVGLGDAARRRIGTFSKGMRQRLGLAQALLGQPRLLLLDEPTSGMDPFLRRHFYDILGQRCATGSAVLLASHALTEIEARASRIAILSDGKLLAEGSLESLRAQAGLPLGFELSLGGPPSAPLQALLNSHRALEQRDRVWRLCCAPQNKMSLLRALSQYPEVVDIAIQPPGLDALYARFSRSHQP